MNKPKVVAVVGATASGKTSLSIELAKAFSGEIISVDSRQIYRSLDIGTGKVTTKEAQGVPHHLLDIVDITDSYSALDFKHDAAAAVSEIINKNKLPIFAGGTFFYLDQLRGKSAVAEVPPNKELRQELEKLSTEELYSRLKKLDTKRAGSIDAANPRRLVRAIEIATALGSVPQLKPMESMYDWLIIGINIEKEVLRDKFKKRLLGWLDTGLLEEVQQLRESGISQERFAELGFEYTLTLDYLDEKITKDEFIQKFIEKNWQYAKRQLTWLRKDREIEWFEAGAVEAVSQRVATFLQK